MDDKAVRITFNMFKKLYSLYPSKWGLYESFVVYRPNENSWDNYIVEFKTFHDVLMYKIFKHRIEKEERNIRSDKTTHEFLKELQKDIDKYREENFSEMEKHIIYCKDCKQFRRYVNTDICFCDITESEMSDNDFCSRAERREDGTD